MSLLTRIVAFISGADPMFLSLADTNSINRYAVYSFYILLYTSIYFFAGFGLMNILFEASILPTVIVSGMIAVFVFFFNRTMIIGETNWLIYLFRVAIVLSMNLLALLVIDSTLFHKDLALYEAKLEGTDVGEVISKHPKAQGLQKEINDLKEKWQGYETLMTEEISAKGGYGVKAKQFEKKAAEFKGLINQKESNYQQLYSELKEKAEDANNGLLTKLKNMFDFTWNDPVAKFIWFIFFILIFVLEIMLLIIKSQARPGLYDMLVERDKLKRMYRLVKS